MQAEDEAQHTSDEKGGDGHGKKGKFDANEVIFGHVMDAHQFHFFSYEGSDGEQHHAGIPLPVLLYEPGRGFSAFLSSEFHHGEKPYNGYRIITAHYKEELKEQGMQDSEIRLLSDEQIVAVDNNGYILPNVKVYDFSLTRNVVQMFIALGILLWLMLSIAKRYRTGQGITSAPKGWQNAIEPVIQFVRDEVAKPNIGHAYKRYMPLLLTIFFFILINNIVGLIPGSANVLPAFWRRSNSLTGTVNGYSFSLTNFTATAGTPTNITLTATGTPAAVGTNTFTINYGDGQSCTFTVTVNSSTPPVPNTDYFPIAANNWWSYDYTDGTPDTLILKVTGPRQIGGQTYQRFEWSSPAAGGPFLEYFYRKDASNGFYYEGVDTAGFGPEVTFTNTNALHINFLRNTLTTGQTWNTDYPVMLAVPGLFTGPSTLRFKFTCTNANATITSSTGRTLTNVYEITSVVQANIGGQFIDAGDPIKTYYARGIGQVKYREDADPANIYEEIIRYWQVN